MLDKRLRYSSFTLVEMLIVMGIIILLAAMAFAAYQNLQTTIRLNEYANNLEQSIRKVQRDAMLLEKKSGENWMYGLGISFARTGRDAETFGNYTAFKWCSPFTDYGDVKTTSSIPNYDPTKGALSDTDSNGSIPTPPTISFGDCKEGAVPDDSMIYRYALFGDRSVGREVDIKIPKSTIKKEKVSAYFEGDLTVQYIVFQAVTGRAFFYNKAGQLLNYTQGLSNEQPEPLETAKPFVMNIIPLRGGKGKKITIQHISGRVMVEGI